jgi:hypothetical protein
MQRLLDELRLAIPQEEAADRENREVEAFADESLRARDG